MNRFTRLVELRRLKEESLALELAKTRQRVTALQDEVVRLAEETAKGREVALADVDQVDHRLPPGLYENYYQGQDWRRQRLEEEIGRAQQAVQQAQQAWFGARTQVKQAEHLEDRMTEQQRHERLQRELRQLDEVGAQRFLRRK